MMDELHTIRVKVNHDTGIGKVRFYRWNIQQKTKGLSYREYTFTKDSIINIWIAKCIFTTGRLKHTSRDINHE